MAQTSTTGEELPPSETLGAIAMGTASCLIQYNLDRLNYICDVWTNVFSHPLSNNSNSNSNSKQDKYCFLFTVYTARGKK